jgi:LysR family transcriptional activator of nhaA
VEWLHYHHLLYDWMVVRTGSVAAASSELRLASPTISVQIRWLEDQPLGRELVDTARGRPTGRPMHVVIGVDDVVPKSIARWLIEPALKLPDPVRITCRRGQLMRPC